ncbi:MAG: hypothetical protein ACQEXJ_22350 [Myxococcota bacterium]
MSSWISAPPVLAVLYLLAAGYLAFRLVHGSRSGWFDRVRRRDWILLAVVGGGLRIVFRWNPLIREALASAFAGAESVAFRFSTTPDWNPPPGQATLANLVGSVVPTARFEGEVPWLVAVSADVNLVLSILAPIALYELLRALDRERATAAAIAITYALTPIAIGPIGGTHNLYVAGVFFGLCSHLLLVRFLREGAWQRLILLVTVTWLFFHIRFENILVYPLLLAVLGVYVRRERPRSWAVWIPLILFAVLPALRIQAFVSEEILSGSDRYGDFVEVYGELWSHPALLGERLLLPEWNHLIDLDWCPPHLSILVLLVLPLAALRLEPVAAYCALFVAMNMVAYLEVQTGTILGNARYFALILPAGLVGVSGLLELGARRVPYLLHGLAVVAAVSLVWYGPRLDAPTYLPQADMAFKVQEVYPRAAEGQVVWVYRPVGAGAMTALMEELDDVVLFDPAGSQWDPLPPPVPPEPDRPEASDRGSFAPARLRPGSHWPVDGEALPADVATEEIPPGDLIYVGLNCYRMSGVPSEPMVPACERHLRDPRNEVVARRRAERVPFNTWAPWWRKGSHAPEPVDLVLLRRR